jgi:hypothetical protein
VHDLQTVLALPQEAMYLALGDYLSNRVGQVGLGNLTAIERTMWLARGFHWAARRGGLLAYMLESGGHASDTEAALRAVGAMHTAHVLREGAAAYLHSPEDFEAAGGRLSDEVEDIPLLVCEYARANRDRLVGTDGCC